MIIKTSISIALLCYISIVVTASPLNELKFDVAKFDPEHVDCKSPVDVVDECGLQQAYSYRWNEFTFPTNHTFLLSSCKRQSDALRCLRAYSKCLPPLSRQVLVALVNSRQKYNKKICTEKQTDASTKVIEFSQCMMGDKASREKGAQAEINAITVPEAIVNTKIDSVQDRIKHSCCSVAKVRKEFMDSAQPNCAQYTAVASDMIDSYLADTVGIVCPDFETKLRQDCEKLPKLTTGKAPHAHFFVRPILNVIQTLA